MPLRRASPPKRRDSIKPIEPLTKEKLLKALPPTAKEFSESCHLPQKYTSKSWWVSAIGRFLGEEGHRVMTDVSAANRDLGLFYYAVKPDFKETIDVIACPKWSERDITVADEYGDDEPFLPPFLAVQILTNIGPERQKAFDLSSNFFEIGNATKGPLTASLICINSSSAESHRYSLQHFKQAMQKLRLRTYDVSTQIMSPGIFAHQTLFEPFEPFQLLIASKKWSRSAVSNPAYKVPPRHRRR
jgi:hypothetical protein